jgi:hypothetical protein
MIFGQQQQFWLPEVRKAIPVEKLPDPEQIPKAIPVEKPDRKPAASSLSEPAWMERIQPSPAPTPAPTRGIRAGLYAHRPQGRIEVAPRSSRPKTGSPA